jgi:hypothetical protein
MPTRSLRSGKPRLTAAIIAGLVLAGIFGLSSPSANAATPSVITRCNIYEPWPDKTGWLSTDRAGPYKKSWDINAYYTGASDYSKKGNGYGVKYYLPKNHKGYVYWYSVRDNNPFTIGSVKCTGLSIVGKPWHT